jgi:hypothetical protein
MFDFGMQSYYRFGALDKKEKLITGAVLNGLLQSAFSLLSNHIYIMNVMKELKWQ